MFLHRGGRVRRSTAVLGSVLMIKPAMHVDNEGHLVKIGTARGRKKAIDALLRRGHSYGAIRQALSELSLDTDDFPEEE